jgi:UDP-N-acetylmuramate--alanine ligase
MNGAVMKNFVSPSAPFASALVGDPELFVSEVDESDGSIALYRPSVALLCNISLDHKEMEELRSLFAGFLAAADRAVANLDDPETRLIADSLPGERLIGFGFDSPTATLVGRNLELLPNSVRFTAALDGEEHEIVLPVPGRHNALNALAAIAAVHALGIPLAEAAGTLARLRGSSADWRRSARWRRYSTDDFAHNPDKIAATLATLTGQPGRLIMFQPHRLWPACQDGRGAGRDVRQGMREGDRLYLPDPVYQGGTADKSRGSDWLQRDPHCRGGHAEHIPEARRNRRTVAARGTPRRSDRDPRRARRHAQRVRGRSSPPAGT